MEAKTKGTAREEAVGGPQENLADFTDRILYEVSQDARGEDQARLVIGSMNLREWVRQQKFKVQKRMVANGMSGQPSSFEHAYSMIDPNRHSYADAEGKEHINPNCEIVSGVSEKVTETILYKMGCLLKEGETLSMLKQSSRWIHSDIHNAGGKLRGYANLHVYADNDIHGFNMQHFPTSNPYLLISVQEEDNLNRQLDSTYTIGAYIRSEGLKPILREPLKPSPFEKQIASKSL